MERNFNTDNFERLLREKSDEFKMYPSKRVWHSVYNNLHPGRRWPSVTMSITLIASLLLVGYLNTDSTRQDLYQANTANETTGKNGSNENLAFSSAQYSLIQNNLNVNTSDLVNGQHQQSTNAVAANIHPAAATEERIVRSNSEKADVAVSVISHPKPDSKTTRTLSESKQHSNINIVDAVSSTVERASGNKTTEKGIVSVNVFSSQAETTDAFHAGAEKAGIEQTNNTSVPVNKLQNNISQVKENSQSAETGLNNATIETARPNEMVSIKLANDAKEQVGATPKKTSEIDISNSSKNLSNTQKDWIENYALYNRPAPKKWKGKLAWQAYITPSVVYRTLRSSNSEKFIMSDNSPLLVVSPDVNMNVEHKPFLGLEIGAGLKYRFLKGIKISAGLQVNYTSYKVHAFENGHPSSTSLTLIDARTNLAYDIYRSTPYSNKFGLTSVNLFNQTFQLSVPLGIDIKIAGTDDIEWYAGSTIQPTLLLGGKSYLISSDRLSYVKATSFLNRFNMNAGFETYVTFKTGSGLTWQVGPEFRAQLFTTNSKVYSVGEKLVNYGIKFGVTKNL